MSGCVDLTPYASSINDLEILTGGGAISQHAPVFFDIPAQVVAGEVNYCLENITIPTNVGGNDCGDAQKCWIVIGIHATNHLDPTGTETCKDASGNSAGCYDCVCRGMSMSTGIVDLSTESLASYCGLHTDSQWTATCGDATHGRTTWADSAQVASNFSSVHVSLCSTSNSGCEICQGGIQPSFRIGMQWISDLQEQCLDHPFGEDCSERRHLASILGITVGSIMVVVAAFALWFLSYRGKKEAFTNEDESCKRSVEMSDASSAPPAEVLISIPK